MAIDVQEIFHAIIGNLAIGAVSITCDGGTCTYAPRCGEVYFCSGSVPVLNNSSTGASVSPAVVTAGTTEATEGSGVYDMLWWKMAQDHAAATEGATGEHIQLFYVGTAL